MKQDRYVRKLAEMENLRTRTAQEVVSAKEFAIQKFCKDLLEVADVMEVGGGVLVVLLLRPVVTDNHCCRWR